MGVMNLTLDPRWINHVVDALRDRPLSTFDLHSKFLEDVPSRRLGLRALHQLLELLEQGGVIRHHNDWWETRPLAGSPTWHLLDNIRRNRGLKDGLFLNRCASLVGEGYLKPNGDLVSMRQVSSGKDADELSWARILSPLCDLRLLTGLESKHVQADFLMIYRAEESIPISANYGLLPCLPEEHIPALPCDTVDLDRSIALLRHCWHTRLKSFLSHLNIEITSCGANTTFYNLS
jgi:hypothetical protein